MNERHKKDMRRRKKLLELETPLTLRPRPARTSEETLRSSEWVGEAPPTTPDSEGWWWWKYRVVGEWTPGRVFRAFGRLNIEVTEDWAPSVAERDHQVIWGGRCVEPGASPTDQAERLEADNDRRP